MKKIYITASLLLFVLSVFFFTSERIVAQSSQTYKLAGYAWSSNIGWISFSDVNSKVQIDSSGNLNGYAWSENVGWLKFGGLSGFPNNDANAVATNAKISNGKIVGWAKFSEGADYSGWDGWVLFSGSNHSIFVDQINKKFSGYAWGSDVVGWIDFSLVSFVDDNFQISCSNTYLTIPLGYSSKEITLTPSVENSSGPYTYKWFKGNPPSLISGETGSSYTLLVATSSNPNPNSGNQWTIPITVNISNSTQSATSSACSVFVTDENNTFYNLTAGTIGSGVIKKSNSIFTSGNFRSGTVVSLVASSTNGSAFVNWLGACSGDSTSCDVTIDSNKNVVAVFNGGVGGDCDPIDGVLIPNGTSKIFYKSRIARPCEGVSAYCDAGTLKIDNAQGLTFNPLIYKFQKCVTPKASEF